MFVQHAGGITPVAVDCNVSDERLFSNVRKNGKRGLSDVQIEKEKTVPALIVGGGPSVLEQLDTILKMKSEGAVVFALNNAAAFLVEHGIRPDYQIVLDARIGNVDFVRYDRADCLLLASQCSPLLFDVALERGAKVRIWHPLIEGIEPHTGVEGPCLIGGGTTVGLSGLCLVYTLGHRDVHLFGYDSSRVGDSSHAYEQALNANDEVLRVSVSDRTFYASYAMVAQAQKFPHLAKELMTLGCNLSMYGDGLLQHMMKEACRDEKVLTAVYDLATSPPTYEFIPFLADAETVRVKGGFDVLDVVFMPGPMHGFRDDNLPPDAVEREGMLHRVCVSACRLLPSVRNVSVLKRRQAIEGDVFPAEWAEDKPVSHYGPFILKRANRCLKATESARRRAKALVSGEYATITLRQSDYWPERNSNLEAWTLAASLLKSYGVTPVFIPDTQGEAPERYLSLPEASWDIDLRLALYEGAKLNLAVSNGPLVLMCCSEVPYMVFKMLTDGGHMATKAAFYKAHGIEVGDQFGPNGKIVWADDTAENVSHEIRQFFRSTSTT